MAVAACGASIKQHTMPTDGVGRPERPFAARELTAYDLSVVPDFIGSVICFLVTLVATIHPVDWIYRVINRCDSMYHAHNIRSAHVSFFDCRTIVSH
jgi:hypothetical protein